jgi:hypothetical protein
MAAGRDTGGASVMRSSIPADGRLMPRALAPLPSVPPVDLLADHPASALRQGDGAGEFGEQRAGRGGEGQEREHAPA